MFLYICKIYLFCLHVQFIRIFNAGKSHIQQIFLTFKRLSLYKCIIILFPGKYSARKTLPRPKSYSCHIQLKNMRRAYLIIALVIFKKNCLRCIFFMVLPANDNFPCDLCQDLSEVRFFSCISS